MSDICHYCHEPITRHEDSTEVVDSDGSSRTYHTDCEWQDIMDHRERGDRLPEDQPGPPIQLPASWKS